MTYIAYHEKFSRREDERWYDLAHYLKNLCDVLGLGFIQRQSMAPELFCRYLKEVPYEKIVCVETFDPLDLDTFRQIADLAQPLGKKIYFLQSGWVEPAIFDHECASVISCPELMSLATMPCPTPSMTWTKTFNAFVRRPDPVRQSWIYLLHSNNLLGKGHVSYLLDDRNSNESPNELFDRMHLQGLHAVKQFAFAYKALAPQMPFCNFDQTNDLTSLISQTKYSLVLDTYAMNEVGHIQIFTEKVVRALCHPTCNLLFVQKNLLHRLNLNGFALEQQMLDIDGMEYTVRQQTMIDILSNDSIDCSPIVLYDMARHNENILTTWLSIVSNTAFWQDILDRINND